MRSLLRSTWTQVCIIVLSGTVVSVAMAAGLEKGINQVEPDADHTEAKSPAAEAVSQLGIAYGLVQYGRANKSPLALLTAAEILHRTPSEPLGVNPTTESGKGRKPDNVAPKQEKPAITVEGLVGEAKSLAAGNDRLLGVAAELAQKTDEKSRGAVGGAKVRSTKVSPFSTDTYKIEFKGKETAAVVVNGDGDTDLDLYVYDQNGNLICSDDDPSDKCVVRFLPYWTGTFTIKVINRGWVYNQYVIATN